MKKVLLVICAVAAVAAAQGPKKDDHLKVIDRTSVSATFDQTPTTGGDIKRAPIAPGVGQNDSVSWTTPIPSWNFPQVFKVNTIVGGYISDGSSWLTIVAAPSSQCIASLQADGTFVLGDGCTKSTALAWMPPASSQVYFKQGATQKQISDAVLRVLLMMGKAQAIDYSMADALIKLAVIRARAEVLPAGEGR